ncbi:hypothetical protein F2Q68_00011328 [Brassica cretica]|uniref:Uncharacterized protein n=1 Tax=Brassica cretica TaxID=69181 RepID=A0A8S9KYM6_BRACR|nr:hypothetical protein F2Q68_00011328 [Brassica cretica]
MKCEANPKNEPQWREPLLNLDDIIKLIRGGGELEIRIKPDPDNGTICRSRKPN